MAKKRTLYRKPTSPGEILFEEFLKPLGLTQKELANHIGCDYNLINRIVNEKARITPDIALRLSFAFETSPNFWLNAQNAVDLYTSPVKKAKILPINKKRRITRR